MNNLSDVFVGFSEPYDLVFCEYLGVDLTLLLHLLGLLVGGGGGDDGGGVGWWWWGGGYCGCSGCG